MKKIALVGSTGSIGKQVINVVRRYPERFKIVALIAQSSAEILREQVALLHPDFAALADAEKADWVGDMPEGTAFFAGEEGALKALKESGADTVFVACGGFAGLKYTLAALDMRAAVALANKETLVCGGDIVMPRAEALVPVDSEHSALWQCLNFDRRAPFSKLVITASGGAFRGRKWDTLSSVTPKEALNHPTWKMGKKITVDCATLLNKGYEVIEAHHLYGAKYADIAAVIHPQSIVHSLVQFADGATVAQLSYPTMELPIQLALTYPERVDCGLAQLDFSKALGLEFLPLERMEYPLFDLALRCGEAGGVLPTALNAASEVAVNAFLAGRLRFTDIFAVAAETVNATPFAPADGYGRLAETDRAARVVALNEAAKRAL